MCLPPPLISLFAEKWTFRALYHMKVTRKSIFFSITLVLYNHLQQIFPGTSLWFVSVRKWWRLRTCCCRPCYSLRQKWALRFAARENLLAPEPGTPLLRRERVWDTALPSPRFLGRSECPAMYSAPPGALFWANSSATCLAGFLGFLQRAISCFEQEALCSQAHHCIMGYELSLHPALHKPKQQHL